MILIAGATGTNGIEIVKLLSRMGVACRALVRSSEKSGALANSAGVKVAYGDFEDRDTLTLTLEGIDRALLISSIDPKLPELQGSFVRAARAAGVRHVVKFSRNGCRHSVRMAVLTVAWRGREGAGGFGPCLHPSTAESIHASVSTLSAHHRVSGQVLRGQQGFIGCPVDVRDIAARAVAVLTGTGHEGKTYVITDPEALMYSDIADKLSAAMAKKVIYVDVPLEAAKQAILDGGSPEWFAEGQAEQFRFRWQGKQARVTSTVADITGKEPRTFAGFAREFAAYFRREQSASVMTAWLPSSR